LYRLMEDSERLNLLEGSCITEDLFSKVYYLDRPIFEVVQDFEITDLIKYNNEDYISEKGIECMLFYNQQEIAKFMEKI